MVKKVLIKQIKSGIGYRKKSKETLRALGLTKMNQAIDEHEAAVESGDNEAQYSTAEKLKSLLRRAELEKIEMAKIESEINQAVAEAAFAGNYSSGLKRKKNG